jgi:hypothetical protein
MKTSFTTKTTTLDHAFLDDVLGVAASSAWPPAGFTPPGIDPVGDWASALLAHAAATSSDDFHYPRELRVHRIDHKGVVQQFLLIGTRLVSRRRDPPMVRTPRVGDEDGTWGGRVDIGGLDLVEQHSLWALGGERRPVSLVRYLRSAAGLMSLRAVAVTATEGLRLRRYVVDRNGERVRDSLETWVVADGEVRRAG